MAIAIAALWRLTPLREYADPEYLSHFAAEIRAQPWAPLVVFGVYVAANALMFPNTAINMTTILSFGGMYGWLCAIGGSLIASTVFFFFGRRYGAERLARQDTARFKKLRAILKNGGIWTIFVVRMVPVAPFSLVNLSAGAIGIKYRHFAIGTLLGLLPGTLTTVLLREQYLEFTGDLTWRNGLILVGIAAIGGGVIFGFARYARRQLRLERR